MIGYLRGTVQQRAPELVLLDVRGVGYEVHIPLSTYYEIERQDEDAPVGLFIHTHVRDTALQLFGFWTEGEKQLFEKLIAVSGIGPRLAQTILSGMAPADLAKAIMAGDLRRLNSIPGVGKKTAERLIVELKDKVQEVAATSTATTPSAPEDDLLLALLNLGYKRREAERAVATITQEQPEAAFPEQLRATLKLLSRA